MPSRLISDGAKIRALRIQRGWTQEQLAEIAGVSARTIQRAESAGNAAFDTLRAVAGAFETDFRELLKSHSLKVEDPGLQLVSPPAPVVPSILESCGPMTPSDPVRPVRGSWKTPAAIVGALAAGLLIGGIAAHRLITPAGGNLPTTPQNSDVVARDAAGSLGQQTEINKLRDDVAVRRVTGLPIGNAVTRRESMLVADKPWNQNPLWQASGNDQPSVPAPQTTVLSPEESTSLELPLQARGSTAIPSLPRMSGAQDPLVILGPSLDEDSGVGAVRGAMGLAKKKTGDALARAGASMKRVF